MYFLACQVIVTVGESGVCRCVLCPSSVICCGHCSTINQDKGGNDRSAIWNKRGNGRSAIWDKRGKLVSQLVGALNPVNHKGLHQG